MLIKYLQKIIFCQFFFKFFYTLRSNCDLASDYVVTQSQATLFGDTHIVQGPMTNYALEFDGEGDYAQFLPTTFGGGSISISFQAKWFSTDGFFSRIMDFAKEKKTDAIFISNRYSLDNFQVQFNSSDQSSYRKQIQDNIILNQWDHYLIIIQQSNIIIIINNQEITENVLEIKENNNQQVEMIQRDKCYIGKSNWDGDDNFHGQIDELTIYDYEVTSEQRDCIYDICNVNYCLKCNGASNICGSCIGNREIPNCDCPTGTYDINQDVCCEHQCIQCSGSANYCDECRGDRINSPFCVCPNQYYDDGISTMCVQCSFEACETCSQQNKCDTCFGSQGLVSSRLEVDCSCPIGYYSNLISQEECIQCNISCNECDINGCTNCVNNRIKDTTPQQEQLCVCESGSIDHFVSLNTYWCTTCTVAVITAKFTNNYDKIIVQFYTDIKIPKYEDNLELQSGTNSLCQLVFDKDLLSTLGQNSRCRLDIEAQQFQIFLGLQPTITNGIDYIIFKQNVIQRSGCPSNQFLNEFKENILQLGDVPLPPSSELILPTSKVTLCQQIEIQIANIINDGLRGLKNLIWSIDSTDSTDTQQIQDLLDNQNLNNNKAMFLNIPMLTLQEYKTYQMQVQYENFAGIIGITKFTIETLSTRGTYAKIQQTQPFIFKNWKQNEFVADINFLDCESGTLQQIDNSLQVDWVDITSDPNNSIPLKTQNTEPKEKISTYQIEKYSSIPGQTYIIEIRVNIPGEPLMETKQFVEYLVEISELLVYIEGGNRLQAYANELDLQGQALDIDVPIDKQKDGISLNWDCINIINQEQCKNIGGVEISLGTQESLHYEKKIFEPYTSYLFTLTGDNGVKSNSGQAIIIVVETDLPVLTVSIPQQVRNQKINLNDDLQMQLESSQDPDEAFYSLIIIYKYEVVATKSYNYNIFAFQIWDIYNDFQTDESEFIMRVSVYDPQYFMPSQSSFTTNINFPPLAGKITINPLAGISLETKFNILCEDFYDEDQPLSYKYSYYTQESHYQQEIQQGGKQIQVYKNILQDFSNQNTFETTLPSGFGDIILLLVSVQDSLGGITNVTQSIQVIKDSENISFNLEKFQNIYDYSQSLNQQLKLSSINILVQEMGQLFLSDDGLTYSKTIEDLTIQQQFLEFKKIIYDDLINYVGNLFSKVLEDQVLKSINILQNVGGNLAELQNEEEIDVQISQIDEVVLNQQQILNNLIEQNLINQGDNSVTKIQNSVTEILGKSMQFIDKLSNNLSQKSENKSLNQTEYKINQQQQIYNSSKFLTNTLQLVMLPNSDQISFYGENISQEVQVLTQKQLQNKYFEQESKGLSLFNQGYNKDQLNLDTKQGVIYKTSGSAFKNNPFLTDKGFPYKDQDTLVLDIDVIEDGEDTDKEINIQYQEISMYFDSNNLNKDSNNICLQRKKGDLEQIWNFENCITEESQEENQIQCRCKSLTPTTIINDIENILNNNKAEEAFSEIGLDALANFNLWKSVIFYIYIGKCVGILLAIYYGFKKDKQDKKNLENYKQKQIENLTQNGQHNKKENKEQKQQDNKANQEVNSSIKNQDSQNSIQQAQIVQNQYNNENDNYIYQKQFFDIEDINKISVQEKEIKNENLKNDKIQKEKPLIQEDIQIKKSKRKKFKKGTKQIRLMQKQQQYDLQDQLSTKQQQNLQEFNLYDTQQGNQNKDIKTQIQEKVKSQEKEEKYNSLTIEDDIEKNENSQKSVQFKSSSRQFLPSQKSLKIYNLDQNQSQKCKIQDQQQQIILSNQGNYDNQSSLQNLNQEEIQVEQCQQQQIKKQPSEALFVFHSLFGIYLVYNKEISRPARYVLYFIRINLLIAVSALFSQQASQYYSLLLSILASVTLAIPCAILQVLLKSQKIVVSIIGFILSLIIFLFALYVVLVTAALMGINKSNQWTFSYISAFSIDVFCIEIIIGYFKVFILKSDIFKNKSSLIKKLIGDESIYDYLTRK